MAFSPRAARLGVVILCALWAISCPVEVAQATGRTRHYTFLIQLRNITKGCNTRPTVTVNGKVPGPKIVTREGDRLVIKVINHVSNNITIHWHGVRQLTTGWADGPAYITQCPMLKGQSYVYNFTITGQRGTLFYHAHESWLRSSVYGALIILPQHNASYPFPKPHKEVPIVIGEWWNVDPETVIAQALRTGGGPNVSDAYTINGLPGLLYNCSSRNNTSKLNVTPGRTYLLRLINAVLDEDLFFTVANHTLTVVETDATYVKPFQTDTVILTPGQTMNVLLKTKSHSPNTTFLMAARPYVTGPATFDNSTTVGLLEYKTKKGSHYFPHPASSNFSIIMPSLPAFNDTNPVTNFNTKLRSLANRQFPANVPLKVDSRFFFTVGLGTLPCTGNRTCQGPNGSRLSAAVNNISFVLPTTALLQAHYTGQSAGVYKPDFPSQPLIPFNYTGTPPNNTVVINDTKVVVLKYNTSVELVMQDTSILGAESHPFHLHGFNFFVVGQGIGNYDPVNDPPKFNLIDPVERNTYSVPGGGWTAIRFFSDNPGKETITCINPSAYNIQARL
ncbi:unnamed protein product [Victoria cruziana]